MKCSFFAGKTIIHKIMMKSDMSYCRKTAVEQVISDFLFHCQYEKNLNEKTIYAYRSDLYMFKRYIHELYPSVVFEQVSKDMLKTYLQHISTYKPKTVKRSAFPNCASCRVMPLT